MSANLTALAYLIASVLFIMALRGLSSPESARSGNVYGMIGMAIAVVTTVINPNVVSYEWILGALVIGGGIGAFVAGRIAMTDMPELQFRHDRHAGTGRRFSQPGRFGGRVGCLRRLL